ncbi:MAG: gamma-glutamylcyclotransferase [Rhodospirillales bacterium]|jgi:cation transport protein ChaC|nr:gamma-glutamylcyclotransferase [Magnetospirillum sp.]
MPDSNKPDLKHETGRLAPCEGCPPPPESREFWVFAYGSLIWDPGFPYEEARPGRLMGFHRSFCVRSTRYRGTPERPGLVLGLDKGGSCRGIAYRVAPREGARTMEYLWEREMLNRSYHCMDLRVTLMDGREVVARTFVVDRTQPGYVGKLDLGETADRIRHSVGQRGANRAYLENTVEHLDRLGIRDRGLSQLLAAVKAPRLGSEP